MKRVKIFSSILFVMFLSLFIIGCSSDDEENNQMLSEIVGTWRCNYEDGYDMYVLKSDGTGTGTEYSYKYGGETWKITYRVNGSRLTIIEDEDGDTSIYEIAELNSSILIVIDENGDSWTFIRQ